MSDYRVRKPGDPVRCGMFDKLDSVDKSILEESLPYSVWGPCLTFALGEVVALCPTKESAERIRKALTLLERVENELQRI